MKGTQKMADLALEHTATTATPLKLRAYSGREHGLMIIGTPDALRALGARLQSASAASGSEWPTEVITPTTEGPYADVPDFTLSFHVAPLGGLPTSLRLTRMNIAPLAFLVLGTLSVIGLLTTIRWITSYVLECGG
jgi:hypothetical protein